MIAIVVNVYIAWRNRRHALAKEEYFKLQQVSERIISKLLILENNFEKFRLFFESTHRTSTQNKVFIDNNDTFNKSEFEKNGHEIASLIEIYFPALKKDWNHCLICMGDIATVTFAVKMEVVLDKKINWLDRVNTFNKAAKKLGTKPKEMSQAIISELNQFKKQNL